MGKLSTTDVSRILGMPEPRVRELVRAGLCRPARRGHRYAFDFADLVVLRAAQGLFERGIPLARVRRALAALVDQLPAGRAVSGVRIFADGRRVAVRDGTARWEPETGQTLLDFEVGPLEAGVATLDRERQDGSDAGVSGDAAWHFEHALALEDEDPQAAANAYTRALDLDPHRSDAYVNLGRLTHEAGDPKEAARMYRLALEQSPGDPIIHFNLALALEDTTGPEPAMAHYRAALDLAPDFADAHFNLAGLCEQQGDGVGALRHFREYKYLTED